MPALVRNHVDAAAYYHDERKAHAGLIEQVKAREAMEKERQERARKAIEKSK
ncbi:hypothetical protein [Pseudoxanthomonas winnipegensis]|uniref:hypothetical protein n=1 Tax=Pseudoxanthomonas winnipegensis TaxID=2480810 RepID=UPI0013F16F3B|nr:hypothetical protein [Pseudoxanthomonas winnipegensis]